MSLPAKIKLSWRFGRMHYLISVILSVSLAVVVAASPVTLPMCFIVKLLSIPVIHYLNVEMTKGLGIYYYLNLGISRREYYSLPFIIEFVVYLLLMTITGIIGYAVR